MYARRGTGRRWAPAAAVGVATVDRQSDFLAAFEKDAISEDAVIVLRFQGPRANGMPELHKLTPALGVLQERGLQVALVTDGRMSGASGKILAAIHCTPEAADGGPLARVRDGDLIRVDTVDNTLELVGVDLADRVAEPMPADGSAGTGRELFDAFRAKVSRADRGASIFDDPAVAT